MTGRHHDPAIKAKALDMLAKGMSVSKVARTLGLAHGTVEYWKYQPVASHPSNHRVIKGDDSYQIEAKAWQLKKQIPEDTRDLTGRLCGDPILERSAFYKNQVKRNA